jgi:hypothetical protein
MTSPASLSSWRRLRLTDAFGIMRWNVGYRKLATEFDEDAAAE